MSIGSDAFTIGPFVGPQREDSLQQVKAIGAADEKEPFLTKDTNATDDAGPSSKELKENLRLMLRSLAVCHDVLPVAEDGKVHKEDYCGESPDEVRFLFVSCRFGSIV